MGDFDARWRGKRLTMEPRTKTEDEALAVVFSVLFGWGAVFTLALVWALSR